MKDLEKGVKQISRKHPRERSYTIEALELLNQLNLSMKSHNGQTFEESPSHSPPPTKGWIVR